MMLSIPFLIANMDTHLQVTCLKCARDQHSANCDHAATDTAPLHFGDPMISISFEKQRTRLLYNAIVTNNAIPVWHLEPQMEDVI